MKIMIIFGTRPEAIKLIPVIKKFREESERFKICICTTGQQREMLNSVLKLFRIKPDYLLNLMKKNQSLFGSASLVLNKLSKVLINEKPDYVLIQGDTITAFATALAAYYLKINIAHIEAGLRTMDKYAPFPEEINRKFIDHLSDLCFSPTQIAVQNLINENIPADRIFITGNTVVDALNLILSKIQEKKIQKKIKEKLYKKYGIIADHRKIILVTTHRRESFGRDLENICKAIKKLSQIRSDVQIIFPVHLNPNVKNTVCRVLRTRKNIYLIEPLDYLSFIWLMNISYFVLTDSGGIQEEAPSLKKPVLVMRRVTERPEGLELGIAKLIGVDSEKIFNASIELLDNNAKYREMLSNANNPYGDGNASKRIVSVFKNLLL